MAFHGFKWRWANIDSTSDPDRYVDIANRTRKTDDPGSYASIMQLIDAQPGERMLEVGCGNGAIARALARHAPGVRQIVASDYSAAMISEAAQRSEDRVLPVSYLVADAARLPFADAAFDRCYAMEVFVILPDPREAFDELARVTRPGGHICIWESDCDAGGIDATDIELTRRIQRFVGDHEYNGAVARQLIGWCKELRWDVSYQAGIGVQERSGFVGAELRPEWLQDAMEAGVVTPEEAETWLEDLRKRDEEGRYFSYLPHFRIVATKPSDQSLQAEP